MTRRQQPIALPRTRRANDPVTAAVYELVSRSNSGLVGPQGPQGPQGAAGSSGGGGSSPVGPEFTYTDGVLTRIDYDDGSYKTLTYSSGRLSQIDFVSGGVTRRKTFNYSGDTLASIDETTL